jgi:triosephosphate isomerase
MAARRKFVCGNWKMCKTGTEAQQLVRELGPRLAGVSAQVGIAPPFTALAQVKWALSQAKSQVQLFGQNCHHEKQGAFTGEVSAAMLKDAGCDGVILGHSERRQLFGETDEGVARKLKAVLGEGLHPIVCVGETLQEREAGRTWEVVSRQVRAALVALDGAQVSRITLAYEPVWAIGTGLTASASDASAIHTLLRSELGKMIGTRGSEIPILYGGSVNTSNAAGLLAAPEIDGLLVGGASVDASSWLAIAQT